MEEIKSFEERLNEWLESKKYINNYMKMKIIMALQRQGIKNYEDLEYYIKNNIKIVGLSKNYGMKYVKEFYDEYDLVEEVKMEEVEKVEEYNNDEYILVEKVEKVNIKNSYINLIKNKINKIDSELNEKDVDDNIINKLKNIYDMINDYF